MFIFLFDIAKVTQYLELALSISNIGELYGNFDTILAIYLAN